MEGVPLFNTKRILSLPALQRSVSAVVVFFVLLCNGAVGAHVFAQTANKEPGMVTDAQGGQSPAGPAEVASSGEASGQFVPVIIHSTVEPVAESWENAEGFGECIDWIHVNLFKTVQDLVQRFDYCFKPSEGEEQIVERSRFRVGLYGEVKTKRHGRPELNLPVDFDAEIALPNMRRRLKLIITTRDPTVLPGKDITDQQDTSLRAAVGRQWRHVSTRVGVRIRSQPELFTNAVWSSTWKRGTWRLYPRQKFYWEKAPGFGEISTLAFGHWKNRWNTRFATSIKWSEQDRDDDRRNERKDKGFRWSEVFVFGYATELLDETQLGRMVSGGDVARGWGLQLAAFGGFHLVDEYRAGVFYRFHLRKKWMYFVLAPDIKWINANDWDTEWTIKCGVEMLFWSSKER